MDRWWLVPRSAPAAVGPGSVLRSLLPGLMLCLALGGCGMRPFVVVTPESLQRELACGAGPEAAREASLVALMDCGFSALADEGGQVRWACDSVPWMNRLNSVRHRNGLAHGAEVVVLPAAGGSLVRLDLSNGFRGEPVRDGEKMAEIGVRHAGAFFARLQEVLATPSPETVLTLDPETPDSILMFQSGPEAVLEGLQRALVERGYRVTAADGAMGLVVAVQDGYAPLFTWERWQGASIQMVTALVRPSAQGTGVRIKTSDSSMETSVPGLGTRLQESMVAGGVR